MYIKIIKELFIIRNILEELIITNLPIVIFDCSDFENQ